MENNTFETVYKWRFLPLVVTGIMLVIVLLLKYVFQIEVGKFFGWSIFLTFAGFIYYRGVLEQKKEKEKKEELLKNPPPPPTKEQVQKHYEDEMQIEINRQKNNIIFRSVYLFFSVLIICFGLTLIFSNKEYLLGIVILFAGILLTIYSIFLLKKWLVLLKTFKEEKKKKVFDNKMDSEPITEKQTLSFDDADNIVEQEIKVADFGGAKPSLTLKKGRNVYLIVECPPFYDGDGNEIDGNKYQNA